MTESHLAVSSALHLRQAETEDAAYLYWLEEACMRTYAVALWGKWTPRPLEYFFIEDHRIILSDDEIAGCVAMKECADHFWLDKLYIAPKNQSRGIGSRILDMIKSECALAEKPIHLNVLINNPALNFYIKNGFEIYSQTDDRRSLAF